MSLGSRRYRVVTNPESMMTHGGNEGSGPAPRLPRVLVVDDMPRVRRSIVRLLRRHGEVQGAEDAATALELMAEDPVDVVLTDHDMPGDDGITLLARVRERHPGIRRVLMSGSVPADLDRHLASGLVERFLPKPIDPTELIDWLLGTR